MKKHIGRFLEAVVRKRFFQGKALIVYGARQVGKTTLALPRNPFCSNP